MRGTQLLKTYSKRLLILGMSAPSLLALKDYDRTYWTECWGLNEAYSLIPDTWLEELNITRWFEVHRSNVLKNNERVKDHAKFLNDLNVPIYTTRVLPDLKNQRIINKDAILFELGWDWFQSTVSWMIGCALYEHKVYSNRAFNEISIFGVDMILTDEYKCQRPGLAHLLDVARKEYGIQITLPENCGLLTRPELYGFDQDEI